MPPKTADPAVRNPYPNGVIHASNRRSDRDVMQGHFAMVDLSDPEARAGVEAAVGEYAGSSVYGVYDRPAELDEHGWPLRAFVTLRDENACTVVVPYSSLRPSQPGRRS